LVTLLLLAAVAGCSIGSEEMPPLCPTNLPAIRSVVVERSGYSATSARYPGLPCAKFRPTAAQVRVYLEKARRVPDYQSADATIVMVPCRARGTVTFKNGRRGIWEIEQARFGNIKVKGYPTMLLYTDVKIGRPFLK
jgi:hypothetical protein